MTPEKELELLYLKRELAGLKKKRKKPLKDITPESSATDGMSGIDKFSAGVGKSIYDTGRGIGQLTGLVSQEEIDQAKALDSELMDSGAGIAGNVLGQIGMVLAPGGAAMKYGAAIPKIGKAISSAGKFAAMPTGLLPSIGSGALLGGTQPVASDESRINKAIVGGVSGGIIPAGANAYNFSKTLGTVWTDKFAKKAAGKVLNRMTSNSDDLAEVIAKNADFAEGVPGYNPTLSEVVSANGGSDTGLSTFQRVMESADPVGEGVKAAISDLSQEQNAAILNGLDDFILNDTTMATAKGARREATKGLYDNLPFVQSDEALEKILATPSAKKAMPYAEEIAGNQYRTFGDTFDTMNNLSLPDEAAKSVYEKGYWGRDLQSINQGMKAATGNINTPAQMKQSMSGPQGDFKAWLAENLPDLAVADKKYAELSKTINQSDIFEALKGTEATGFIGTANNRLNANQFLKLVENENRLLKNAGDLTGVTTLDNALEPGAKNYIDSLKSVLRTRATAGSDAAAKGSPTAQNLIGYDLVSGALNGLGLPERWAGGGFLQNMVETPLSKALMTVPENKIKRELAEAFINPRYAGILSEGALEPAINKNLGGLLGSLRHLGAVSGGSYLAEQ